MERTVVAVRSGAASRPATLLVLVAGLISAAACVALGWGQFQRGEAHTYDLGIFSQSAASWASGQLPTSDILGGKRLLGDHFSPLTVVFGLVWTLWPDPRGLVIAQGVLLGLGTALVSRAAVRNLPLPAAAGVAVSVLVAHGSLAAARFDVHEVALAVPFLALSATALLERRHLAAAGWSLPLLVVKEDLGATVMVVAVLVFCSGRRRLGVLLALAAVAGLALALGTMAAVSPAHDLSRLSVFSAAGAAGPTVWERSELLLVVVVGGGVVWVRSPLALLTVPTLMWRLASHERSYVSSVLHYDAVLVPVIGVALVDVLRRLATVDSRDRPRLGAGIAWAGAGCSAVVTAILLPPATVFTSVTAWEPGPRLTALREAAVTIPQGARVAADSSSGAYLLGRSGGDHDVFGWSADQPVDTLPQWVVIATDRASVGTTLPQSRAWLARVRTVPGVVVTEVGTTAVVHFTGEH
ncbi:MAG: DUF2079 domain-containing protein [Janthinobacterium lividum]